MGRPEPSFFLGHLFPFLEQMSYLRLETILEAMSRLALGRVDAAAHKINGTALPNKRFSMLDFIDLEASYL